MGREAQVRRGVWRRQRRTRRFDRGFAVEELEEDVEEATIEEITEDRRR